MNRVIQVGSLANKITSTRDNPQRQRVYLTCGLSPALNTCGGGGLMPYIVVAERSRDRHTDKDKRVRGQQLEPNDKFNALTTVQKDNLILEIKDDNTDNHRRETETPSC